MSKHSLTFFLVLGCACARLEREGGGPTDGPLGDRGGPGPAPRGEPAVAGTRGLNAGASSGLVVTLEASKPANGTHFVTGERPALTITLKDDAGRPVERSALSQGRLMVAGPMEVMKTRTAVRLLATSADYKDPEHHYVNLVTSTKPNLEVAGNVLTFLLEAVSNEEAGTYLVGFWAVSKAYPLDQAFPLVEIQIGQAAAEKPIVARCSDCHKGAVNNVLYLHHVDPTGASPGNWALDADPPRACKTCHNQAGYAGYCGVQGQSPCEAASRIPDPLVRRVHGVHRGKGLRNPFNVNPETGDFRNYVHVAFPAGPLLCTKCHTDDAWKTKPSQLACGTCHDNLDFARGTLSPPRVKGTPTSGKCKVDADCAGGFGRDTTCNAATGACELALHNKGKAADDASCVTCHGADSGESPVSVSHGIQPPPFQHRVELSMVPPRNGTYYVDGETPVAKVALRTAAGALVDPAGFTEAGWRRLNFYVSGPRSGRARPALTTAAKGARAIRAQASCATAGPWPLGTAGELSLRIDGASPFGVALAAGAFADPAAATAAELAARLNADPLFHAVATASVSANRLVIRSNRRGATSSVEVLAGAVAGVLGCPSGVQVPVETRSYANNDLRVRADRLDEDPQLTRVAGADGHLEYLLGDVKGLEPGTYVAFVEALPATGLGGWAKLTFQVGTKTADSPVATNCTECHEGTRMHAGSLELTFDTDLCLSCHDYERQIPGRAGWAAGQNNNGFGSGPLSRRIHGVHFGRYVDKPLEIHPTFGAEYAEVIFPQDVRNCTKCHAKSDAWKQRPSRLACFACHDSDPAILHGALNTLDPTPREPFSGDEQESCLACHAVNRQYSADKVHSIAKPFKPPYAREPADRAR